MPSLKDIAKVTAIAKVAYNKVYDLLEDDAKISDTIEKAEGILKKFPQKLDKVATIIEESDNAAANQFK